MDIIMKKKTLLFTFICTLLLAGCGKQETTVAEQDATVAEQGTVETQTPSTESEVSVTAAYTYGNTMGNLYNAGLFLTDTDGMSYMYNMYRDYTHKTLLPDCVAESLLGMSVTYLNCVDSTVYGLCNSLTEEPCIIAFDTTENTYETIREGAVDYLQVVNGNLYFTDATDSSLRKLNLETKEETTLVAESVYYPVVYEDRIIFQSDADGESLYSISTDGGESTRLNSVSSHYPLVYHDKIYYCDNNNNLSIRCMNLDGSEDTVWLDTVSAEILSIWDDTLYFYDANNPSVLSFVDLTLEDVTVQTLDFTESVKTELQQVYGEGKLSSFEIQQISNFNISGDYILLFCNEMINGSPYADEYIYNRETGDVYVVTALLHLDDLKTTEEDDATSTDTP